MFDSHCHLNMEVFKDTLREVINEARDSGVDKFIIPGIDLRSSKEAVNIANLYNGVYAAVGIHPTDEYLENIDTDRLFYNFEEIALSEDKVKAIGETGLDYYRYSAPIRVQQEYFLGHIRLALRTNKALIVHSRQSTEDVVRILKDNWSKELSGKVVFHAAEAIESTIKFAERNKVFIGIDGDVTYDPVKMGFVKKVPLELLVLETDSPYLTPKPIRDSKKFPNTPANLKYIAKKVAEIKSQSIEKVVKYTSDNALELFSI